MANITDVTVSDEPLYWDHRFKRHTIKLLPGDFDVVNGEEMLVTVLGSCVAACIRDTKSGIGGMNHFLLPSEKNKKSKAWNDYDSAATRYGDLAMEQLINKIVALGGKRENFEAKIFGGARMFATSFSDIGGKNIEFVTHYLKTERIRVASNDTAGNHARKVYYIPSSGDVFLKRITKTNNDTIQNREKKYLKEARKARTTADISFF
ncbi:MAG: chemoreceptor glutamine deamidase CheD [Gammaproteobacteria bacterium]|jgi:chemotaxis protein CheD|nr:chemoreceptor glutamine deamidase CheD [Gammaproteobacteria bacterium]MBT6552580.1 chemoreceptor glutamine deamidase CheD [Gammaproteobacteria bacterium]MBT7209090.1 chemoreceptor glutamine deamidase CheD [Gammaproteobacteria bacterium]